MILNDTIKIIFIVIIICINSVLLAMAPIPLSELSDRQKIEMVEKYIHFEYNPDKNEINIKKHKISFEVIKALWAVRNIVIPAKTVNESRFIIIGEISNKLSTCVFTKRSGKIRIISARRSNKGEKREFNKIVIVNPLAIQRRM